MFPNLLLFFCTHAAGGMMDVDASKRVRGPPMYAQQPAPVSYVQVVQPMPAAAVVARPRAQAAAGFGGGGGGGGGGRGPRASPPSGGASMSTAAPSGGAGPCTTLFVANLGMVTTEEEIKSVFIDMPGTNDRL